MPRKLQVFGPGGGGPITVLWTGDTVLPVRFNEGASFVIAVNTEVVDASSVIADIHKRTPERVAEAIVFELFAAGMSNSPIEIGRRVPAELVATVLKSCERHGVSLTDIYRVDDDGRFGYCQRMYIGSRAPSGARIPGRTVADLIKNFHMPKA